METSFEGRVLRSDQYEMQGGPTSTKPTQNQGSITLIDHANPEKSRTRPVQSQLEENTIVETSNESLLEDEPLAGTGRTGWLPSLKQKIKNLERRFQGWRMGAIVCASASLTVLLINMFWIIVVAAKYGRRGGLVTIQEGSCSQTKSLNLWLHLLINILGTILLSASNYCMQCLSSPTREDIDKAHARNTWLDIGIPSTRNLNKISSLRLCLWLILGLSSVPLHLFYNSAIIQTRSAQEYAAFVAYPDMWTDSKVNWSAPVDKFQSFSGELQDPYYGFVHDGIPILEDFRDSPSWEHLDKGACLQAYGKPYQEERVDIIAISSTLNATTPMQVVSKQNSFTTTGNPPGWVCSAFTNSDCTLDQLKADPANWTIVDVLTDEGVVPGRGNGASSEDYKHKAYPVQYCLSKRVKQQCTIQMSVVIMTIVICCNAAKAICMIALLWYQKSDPLVTLGDAIQSFLNEEDLTTRSMCLVDKSCFTGKNKHRPWYLLWPPRPYEPRGERWFRSASIRRWLTCYITSILTIITAIILIRLGVHVIGDEQHDYHGPSFWQTGFGVLNTSMMGSWSTGLLSAVLLSNLPQLLLSGLYLAYNSLYTCMLLVAEWSSYAHNRKPLRVTDPQRSQRSTYRLQLPYKYGIPLLIVSALLHWLVSQSIFVARVNMIYRTGGVDAANSIQTVGYSVIPMVVVSIYGFCIIVAGLLVGLKKHATGMPLTGSCSAAISAACHLPLGSDGREAAKKPVMWGAIDWKSPDGEFGHCTFTSDEVSLPVEGQKYA